eukprot:COSAG02_NODE_7677_length_2898_cov_5.833869_3_plen_448_part_00
MEGVNIDTLTEASETDIAEYEAEVARFVTLREKYKQGAYAKTREGQVGMVTFVENTRVLLRLADGTIMHDNIDKHSLMIDKHSLMTDINTLTEASETEYWQGLHDGTLSLCIRCFENTVEPWKDVCNQCENAARASTAIGVFGEHPAKRRNPAAGRQLVKGYCKSRFDRELTDEQLDVTVEFLCEKDPPIVNRYDPRFGEIFEILDALGPGADRDSDPAPGFDEPSNQSDRLSPRRSLPEGVPRINEPGVWEFMISYTQRNPTSEALAYAIEAELKSRGKAVWLDVKMAKRDEAAMQEGVENSQCVIAVVSDAPEGQEELAYFRREFCLKELRWATSANVWIQPVVAAEDKSKICSLFEGIPADLQHLKDVNWEHIDRKDVDYLKLGVSKIIHAAEEGTRKATGCDANLAVGEVEGDAKAELEPAPELELHNSRNTQLHTQLHNCRN